MMINDMSFEHLKQISISNTDSTNHHEKKTSKSNYLNTNFRYEAMHFVKQNFEQNDMKLFRSHLTDFMLFAKIAISQSCIQFLTISILIL